MPLPGGSNSQINSSLPIGNPGTANVATITSVQNNFVRAHNEINALQQDVTDRLALTGLRGPNGPIGLTGVTGVAGATGATGVTGVTGAKGPQGTGGGAGAGGALLVATVSADPLNSNLDHPTGPRPTGSLMVDIRNWPQVDLRVWQQHVGVNGSWLRIRRTTLNPP